MVLEAIRPPHPRVLACALSRGPSRVAFASICSLNSPVLPKCSKRWASQSYEYRVPGRSREDIADEVMEGMIRFGA